MQAHELLLPLYRGAREVPADLFIDWALDLLRTIVPFGPAATAMQPTWC